MDDDQQFCLRWNNHQSTLISVFDTLLENGTLVDCTLAAEGKFLKAHKVVLSACSPYFASLLSQQYDKHPIFILKDVKFQELRAMMDYMYRGEVNISQDQLAALLKAAESLQIKGLSDSRSSTATTASSGSHKINEHKQQQQQLNVPGSITGKSAAGISGGYTLEQKRPRHALGGPSSIESQELTGSREGSSSPTSRKRKKIRRRSVDNVMADNQEHSNSSSHSMQVNSSSNTAGAIATVSQGAIASSLAAASASGVTTITGGSIVTATGGAVVGSGVTKKTESGSSGIKGIGGSDEREIDHDNDDNQGVSATVGGDHDKSTVATKKDHIVAKRKSQQHQSIDGKDSELLIEPKSEYDDGNDETVEDLTLDDEELLEDLEQAGPSHTGGEGSSQGYAQWQVDRSQDEVFMATQEAAGQQRDPQVKHDKSEQTDITPEEFELDDCLLESNDIVITQNKDGFVLHVKKLGNVTTAKLAPDDGSGGAVTAERISPDDDGEEEKRQITTLTSCHAIKLPSSECELINLKKITPSTSSAIATTATIIQPQHVQEHTSIVTANQQTINSLLGLREVNIQPKSLGPRIKYSRGKIATPPMGTVGADDGTVTSGAVTTVQMTATKSEPEMVEKKYEITEIDLNNAQASASIISDLVKYAEIDDIELPDGTKIGIGFAPADISGHIQTTQSTVQQVTEHHTGSSHATTVTVPAGSRTITTASSTSGAATGGSGGSSTAQESAIAKSYTILTTTPMKTQSQTYELSVSDNSMTYSDESDTKLYICRHCGKKYRWKSTLRRHENVECGGKEPCHPCPYCSYKAKQRGNLGVHVRKHHPDKPQLASKRGRRP